MSDSATNPKTNAAISEGAKLHKGKYRPEIDGLRAIAVLSVVIYHAFPSAIPGGFVGVDIFFVISGFLISSILLKELSQNTYSIVNFYKRRIRRIAPALVVVMFFIMICGWAVLFRPEFSALGKHLLASTFFSENFYLWSQSSYFDVSSHLKPTLHLWSLAVEEQFYILWPPIMYVMYRLRLNVIVSLALLLIVSFVLNAYQVKVDPTAAYYSPFGRAWELLLGACLAYLSIHRPNWLEKGSSIRSILGLIFILIALVAIGPSSAFPGFWALLPCLGAALIISAKGDSWVNRYVLSNDVFVWFGLISYPLYLWHWPLISFNYIIFNNPTALESLIAVIVSIAAAAATFYFVEAPFRVRGSKRLGLKWPLMGLLLAVVFAITIATNWLLPRLDHFRHVPTKNEWSFIIQKFGEKNPDVVGVYRLHPERRDRVLYIGDSHIAQYVVRLNKVMDDHSNALGGDFAIGGGCVAIQHVYANDTHRQDCWPMRDRAYRMSHESKYKTIVIGGDWFWYFLNNTPDPGYILGANKSKLPLVSKAGRAEALSTLGADIRSWRSEGKKVYFILDNPTSPRLQPNRPRYRLSKSDGQYQPDSTISVNPDQIQLDADLRKWATANGASVINPYGAVCQGTSCKITSNSGVPLYKNSGHFNPAWTSNNASFMDQTLLNTNSK